jgi:riboflavin synthase
MFTGIIKYLGSVKENKQNKLIVQIRSDQEVNIGDSVACNGVCLTVTKIESDLYSFDLCRETLEKTNLSQLKVDNLINIEFGAKFCDKIDGHIVTGHVHGLGAIQSIEQNDTGWIFSFKPTQDILKYIIDKGSVAINGISLTISSVKKESQSFEVNILPYTFEHTNLKNAKIGDQVNIEPDLFATYVMNIIQNMKL